MLQLVRHRLRRFSSIALLAIFGLALAPTISHALNHARGGSIFNEVCTPEGMKQLSVDMADAGNSSNAPALNHMEHCPLCGLTAASLAVAASGSGPLAFSSASASERSSRSARQRDLPRRHQRTGTGWPAR